MKGLFSKITSYRCSLVVEYFYHLMSQQAVGQLHSEAQWILTQQFKGKINLKPSLPIGDEIEAEINRGSHENA